MSADRFEIELRKLLREEAATAPVVMSIHDLRARAGSAPRFAWLRWPRVSRIAVGAAAVAAVAVVAVLGLNPVLFHPTVGQSPSPTDSPSPTASSASPVPSIRNGPSATAMDLGPSGSILVARITGDRLDIVSADPSGSETPVATIESLTAVLGDWHLPEDPVFALASNGHLALAVERGSIDTSEAGAALIDLTGTDPTAEFLPTGGFAFGPDGSLVLLGNSGNGQTINRIDDPSNPGTPTAVPVGVTIPTSLDGGFAQTADGSGVFATREKADAIVGTPVILRWDGAVVHVLPYDPSIEPLLATGDERPFGKFGQTAFRFADSGASGSTSSGLAVMGPERGNLALPGSPDSFAWTRDGTRLVVLVATRVFAYDGTSTMAIASMPAGFGQSRIVGFTDDAVLVRSADGRTARVSLDGSGSKTLNGILVGVVP
jgi:hypothetical protein